MEVIIINLPPKLWFGEEVYRIGGKIEARCNYKETVDTLNGILSDRELNWFIEHPQFSHIFHMKQEEYRKHMGVWLLLHRTAKTMMLDECWFIVNGIPIRYSVREHALITGLSCGPLPDNYDRKSSRCDFIKKHFGGTSKIDFLTVKKKLEAMTEEGEGDDRLKIAVLYFLTSVIAGKRKQTTKIDDFLVNIVDDLPLCRRFPWGSYTFKNCVAKIRNYVENQKGIPNPSFCFEGFYLGLEVYTFLISLEFFWFA